jgi:hypothetical protein
VELQKPNKLRMRRQSLGRTRIAWRGDESAWASVD